MVTDLDERGSVGKRYSILCIKIELHHCVSATLRRFVCSFPVRKQTPYPLSPDFILPHSGAAWGWRWFCSAAELPGGDPIEAADGGDGEGGVEGVCVMGE